MKVGDLVVMIGGDTTPLKKSIDKAEKDLQSAGTRLGNIFKNAFSVATGMGIFDLSQSIKNAAASVWEFYKNTEKASMAFEVMLGSAGKANSFMRDLKAFAAETPFEFEDIEEAANRLLAFGFAARDIIPMLEAVGNAWAVTGGSKEDLYGIIRALGQIKTKGRAQAEELMQLAERNIPVYQILQEELGLTSDQVANIGEYSISADKVISAILRGIQRRYGGMMNELSDTTDGIISNIKDSFKILGTEIFRGAFEKAKGNLRRLRDFLFELVKAMQEGGINGVINRLVPQELRSQITIIIGAIKSFTSSLGQLWSAIKPIATIAFKMFIAGLSVVLPLLAAVTKAIATLSSVITQATPFIGTLAGAIIGLKVAAVVSTWLSRLTGAIKGLTIANVIALAIDRLRNSITLLNVALLRSPLGIVLALAGAFLGLAMSSETASNWLEKVYNKLAKLVGIDISLPRSSDQELDDYTKEIENVGEGIGNIGDEANKSKKKLEKFIAAFDEVYQVPESLDDVSGGGSGIGEIGEGITPEKPTETTNGEQPGAGGDFGTGLIPLAIEKLGNLKTALQEVGVAWENVAVLAQQAIAKFGFAPVLEPVLERLRQLNESLVTIPAGALAIATAFRTAGQLSTVALNGISTSFDELKQKLSLVPVGILNAIASALEDIRSFGATIVSHTNSVMASIRNLFITLPSMVSSGIMGVVTLVRNTWTQIPALATNFLNGVQQAWSNFVTWIQGPISSVVNFVKDHWKGILLTASSIVLGVLAIFGGLPSSIAGIIATVVSRIGPILGRIWPLAQQAGRWVLEGVTRYGPQIVGFFQRIPGFLSNIGPRLFQIATNLGNKIKTGLESVMPRIQQLFSKIGTWAQNAWEKITNIASKIGSWISSVFSGGGGGIATVPGMASGGIATRPQIVGIAEKGPEAVIPLERLHEFIGGGERNGSGGEITINIGVLVGDDRSLAELERRLNRIRKNERRRGVGD